MAADIAVELQGAVLGQHAHGVDAGIGAVGQGKVNDAELAPKGHRGLCHVAGEDIQAAALSAGRSNFLLICSTSKIAISAPPLSEIIQFFL